MSPDQIPLYVRLAADSSRRLDIASTLSGKSKRQIVEEAVREHLGDGELAAGRSCELRSAAPNCEPPEVLNLEGAAALLRVPPDDLRALADTGGVPGQRIAGHWRFARTGLIAWLGHSPGSPL